MRFILALCLLALGTPAGAQTVLTNYPGIPAVQVDLYADGSWHLRHGGHWYPEPYSPSPIICQGIQDWLNPVIETWGIGMYAYPETTLKGYPVQGFVQWYALTPGGADGAILYNVGGACNAARSYNLYPGPGSPASPYSTLGLNAGSGGGGSGGFEMDP